MRRRVVRANLFARAHSIADTCKLPLAHGTRRSRWGRRVSLRACLTSLLQKRDGKEAVGFRGGDAPLAGGMPLGHALDKTFHVTLLDSGRQDLNLRPQRPERCALAKLSYAPSLRPALLPAEANRSLRRYSHRQRMSILRPLLTHPTHITADKASARTRLLNQLVLRRTSIDELGGTVWRVRV